MLKPSTLHKRGRKKRKRRRKPTPTTGYFVGRRHYQTLMDVWHACGVGGDTRRLATKEEAIYGDVLACSAADANGVFYVNGRRVQIAAKLPVNANVKKGLARLDRIAAEVTAGAAAA